MSLVILSVIVPRLVRTATGPLRPVLRRATSVSGRNNAVELMWQISPFARLCPVSFMADWESAIVLQGTVVTMRLD